jgi:hypothetical protein
MVFQVSRILVLLLILLDRTQPALAALILGMPGTGSVNHGVPGRTRRPREYLPLAFEYRQQIQDKVELPSHEDSSLDMPPEKPEKPGFVRTIHPLTLPPIPSADRLYALKSLQL